MSEGEKTPGELVPRRGRWFWPSIAATVGGSITAGFGAAVVSGIPTSFGQPLATIIGGTGVLAAGTLAYLTGQRSREQAEAHHRASMDREIARHRDDTRRARESDLRDRYTATASQIAHESAAIRQAGVYALTALADDWHVLGEDDERQVCINLLQWYLRVPFPVGDDPEKPNLSEREIRQTIVRILSERRQRPPGDPRSWAATSISLYSVSLPMCGLSGLELSSMSLVEAHLTNANLSHAELNDADLMGAELNGAKLYGANLSGANLSGAKLNGANLYGAELNDADLSHAELNDAELGSVKLNDAQLFGAELNDADLSRANLNSANLSGAKLKGARLSRAKLYGAELSTVHYDAETIWPEGFTPDHPPI